MQFMGRENRVILSRMNWTWLRKDWFGVVSSFIFAYVFVFVIKSAFQGNLFLFISCIGVFYSMWSFWFLGPGNWKQTNKILWFSMIVICFIGLIGFLATTK